MKRAALLIGLGLLALSPPPAAAQGLAQATAQPDAAAIEASRVAVETIDAERAISDRAYAGEMLGHLDRLASATAGDAAALLAIDTLRLLPLVALERAEEARALIDSTLQRRPNQADPYALLWWASVVLEDRARGLAVVEQASRNVSGAGWAELREVLERDTVFALFEHFQAADDRASRLRLAEALFRIGWPGPEARTMIDSIRLILLEHRLEQGDRAAAAELAGGLSTPINVAALIVERRFDPLLPAGTDRLARLRQALEEHDRHTAASLAEAPRDTRRLLDRVDLLRSLARDGEALALLQPFTRELRATAMADEDGKAVIMQAFFALSTLGRKDEALALLARLVALPTAEHNYLLDASITYGDALWSAGRHADSLAHARRLERELSQSFTSYGRMWIQATIVCALASLDRAGEAAPALERMRAAIDDNPDALTRAYLCLNDLAGAEQVMIRRLEHRYHREGALLTLQDYQLATPAEGPDPLLDRLMLLRDRPALRTVLERIGRVMQLPVARTYWGSF